MRRFNFYSRLTPLAPAFLAVFNGNTAFVRVRAGIAITLDQIGTVRMTISFTDCTVISALRAIISV